LTEALFERRGSWIERAINAAPVGAMMADVGRDALRW
jgi:hypothetical protein